MMISSKDSVIDSENSYFVFSKTEEFKWRNDIMVAKEDIKINWQIILERKNTSNCLNCYEENNLAWTRCNEQVCLRKKLLAKNITREMIWVLLQMTYQLENGKPFVIKSSLNLHRAFWPHFGCHTKLPTPHRCDGEKNPKMFSLYQMEPNKERQKK